MSRKFRVLAVFLTVIIVVCGAVPALSASKKRGRNTAVNSQCTSTLQRAQQGDAKAQYSLGNMYFHGYPVKQNYAEAAKWYRKGAEQGLDVADRMAGKVMTDRVT